MTMRSDERIAIRPAAEDRRGDRLGGQGAGAAIERPHPSARSASGLDWFTFFVADVQTGFGPFIAVYLTSHKWTQTDIGLVLSILVVWLHAQGVASEWWLLFSLSFIGIAQGAVISPNQALTLAEVPLQYAGSSGGIMQTGQRVGTSIGIAAITAISFGVLAISTWAAAFMVGFLVIAVVVLVALGVAFRDLRQRHGNAWL